MLAFCNVFLSLTGDGYENVVEGGWNFVLAPLENALVNDYEVRSFGVVRDLPVPVQPVDQLG